MRVDSKRKEMDPKELLQFLKDAEKDESLNYNQEELFKNIDLSLVSLSNNQEFWPALNGLLQNLSAEDKLENLIEHNDSSVARLLHKVLITESKKDKADNLSGILDAITIIADTNKGRERFFTHLEDIVNLFSNCKFEFSIKLEICKLINILLEQLPKARVSQLKNGKNVKIFLEKSGDHLREAGDFDLQATILEALFRLLDTNEKELHVKNWFKSDIVKGAFLTIRNEEFEYGCRTFLNELNSNTSDRRVYSYPCLAFYLGMYELKAPGYHDLKTFWVDFNVGSKSISAFVNDDASDQPADSAWEVVVIKAETVADMRVNDNGKDWMLILKLNTPPCELLPFCPKSPERYAKITFSKEYDILTGLSAVLGKSKYTEFPLSSPNETSTPTKASSAQNPFWIGSKATGSAELPVEKEDTTTPKKSVSIGKTLSTVSPDNRNQSDDQIMTDGDSSNREMNDAAVEDLIDHAVGRKAEVTEEPSLKELHDGGANILIDGIVPETQEDCSIEVTKEVQFLLPQQIISSQPATKKAVITISDGGQALEKNNKKKRRKLPERKSKTKPKARSVSPFAFRETTSDDETRKPSKSTKPKVLKKTKPAVNKNRKVIHRVTTESSSTDETLWKRKFFGSSLKTSGEEYIPEEDEIKRAIGISDEEMAPRQSDKSFTDPRIVKKKRVKKTFEKKRLLRGKSGRARKRAMNKSSILEAEWDELLLDSDDENTLDSKRYQTRRGKMQQKKQKDSDQSASYKGTNKVTKVTSNRYGKEKGQDYISQKKVGYHKDTIAETKGSEGRRQDYVSKRKEDYHKEAIAVMKEINGKRQDYISKKKEDYHKNTNAVTKDKEGKGKRQDFMSKSKVELLKGELNATKKKTIVEEDIESMDYDIDPLEYTPATSRSAKFRGKDTDKDSQSYDNHWASPTSKELQHKSKAKKSLLTFVGNKAENRRDHHQSKSVHHISNSTHGVPPSLQGSDTETLDDETELKLNPVDSFALICKKIVNFSRQGEGSCFDDSENINVTETPRNDQSFKSRVNKSADTSTRSIPKAHGDSGIISDISANILKADADITLVGKDPCTPKTTKPQRGLLEDDLEQSVEEHASEEDNANSDNEQDAISQGSSKHEFLAHLKTPEVVKHFRKTIQNEKANRKEERKKIPRRNKKKPRIADEYIEHADESDSSSPPSPVPRKRRKAKLLNTADSAFEAETETNGSNPFAVINKGASNNGTDSDLQSVLASFGDQLENAVRRKQTLVQRFTESTADILKKRLSSVWRDQREERQRLICGISSKLQGEMDSLRKQMEGNQDREEKILTILLEHQKERLKSITLQKQGLDNIHKINSQLFSGLVNLEDEQSKQKVEVDTQLRKELSKMQARLLSESRRQEIHNVQRNLKGILSSL